MSAKDWSGNSKATYSCLGASNHSDKLRETHDYYATDPAAIDCLKSVYDLPLAVCEPCCGEGHLSKRLERLGHTVYSSDLVDRGYGEVKDFLKFDKLPEGCRCVLTNPPYRYLNEIMRHALELLPDGGICAMFVKLTALEGLTRYKMIYRNTPPPMGIPVHRQNHMRTQRRLRVNVAHRQRGGVLLDCVGKGVQGESADKVDRL